MAEEPKKIVLVRQQSSDEQHMSAAKAAAASKPQYDRLAALGEPKAAATEKPTFSTSAASNLSAETKVSGANSSQAANTKSEDKGTK
jgi:hypothetical protein